MDGYRPCKFFAGCGHADRIRAMSDEELAGLLLLDGRRGAICDDQAENEYGSVNCFGRRLKLLQQPYESEETP